MLRWIELSSYEKRLNLWSEEESGVAESQTAFKKCLDEHLNDLRIEGHRSSAGRYN